MVAGAARRRQTSSLAAAQRQHRPRAEASRRSSSSSRSTHVSPACRANRGHAVLNRKSGWHPAPRAVRGARRWVANPRGRRIAARLTRETRACVRAAGQRGSKKLRVCSTAIRDEDSAAESVLFAHRSSAMRHTERIAPRTVGLARLRAADGRPKAREPSFSMVCTALISLVVCGKTGIQ